MSLIPNFGQAPKMFVIQALAAIVAVQGVWVSSPAVQALVPPEWLAGITGVLAVLGGIGRLVAQASVQP